MAPESDRQLDLFGLLSGLPAQAHSDTSRAAASRFFPKAKSARERVFDVLERHGRGLTDEEQQRLLCMNASTQRPRRIELVRAGRVRDSGRRRKTGSGCLAAVWIVVEHKP